MPGKVNQVPLAVQPFGLYSGATVVPHVQPPARVRESVMVLLSTGPGALRIVQAIVPTPVAVVPDAVIVQLPVVAVPPIKARVGSVP